MKTTLLSAILFIAVSLVHGAEKPPVELQPDIFQFLRTAKKTFPASPGMDHSKFTVTYGVFTFRYSHPQPLQFWGFDPPDGRKFITRFTAYRVLRKSGWEKYPIGYCGTGATTYVLQPGLDYELWINLLPREATKGAMLRVSASSQKGEFWSEPFTDPK